MSTLNEAIVQLMFQLLSLSFINVHWEHFLQDLKKKDTVILLYDNHGELVGFSTQLLIRHMHEGRRVRVVFSGDTIIAKRAWGSMELSLVWGEWMMNLLARENTQMFWLLISKGIRTYKFLPTFFRTFYPRPDEATPSKIAMLMNELGLRMFPESYSQASGLVHPIQTSYYLTPSLAQIPYEKQRNRTVSFFLSKNPLYRQGAELLCLAEFTPENLRGSYYRRLQNRASSIC